MRTLREVLAARAQHDPRRVPLRRHRLGPRRLVSAGLAAVALAGALQVLAPRPAAGVPAVVLGRDLPAGARLQTADLRTVQLPAATVPTGALTGLGPASGRVLAAAGRAGEVLTDVRLVGPGLLTGQPPGQVGAPVRVADPAAAVLVAPGDRVDVLLATEGRADAAVVVRAATVLARPLGAATGGGLLGAADTSAADSAADSGPADSGGGLLVLAVSGAEAAALAGAAARGPLSITLR